MRCRPRRFDTSKNVACLAGGAQFELGLAPSWDSLAQTAKGDDKTLDMMTKAGLVARKDTGRVYDRFRSRIIFPIHDYKGQWWLLGADMATASRNT